MKFSGTKPIYLQISDHIKLMIEKKKWLPGERIPSIRELAVQIEVNPNTVSKTYSELQTEGIIFNKRGLGYFVSDTANHSIKEKGLDDFHKNDLPFIFDQMIRYGMNLKDLEPLFNQHKEKLK